MAITKELQTRILLRHDTLENWNKVDVEGKGGNLVLMPGEIGICFVPAGSTAEGQVNPPHVMMKVGAVDDEGKGIAFKDLPWISAKAADVYHWAKKSGIEVEDNGTGSVISDIAWDSAKEALVVTRIDVYTKGEVDGLLKDKLHTQAEIENIAAAKINALIGAADDEGGETIQNVANLVDYVEKNAGEIAQLVTDVKKANDNASAAVETANSASEAAKSAAQVAGEAKEQAQAAQESATSASGNAAASAAAAY